MSLILEALRKSEAERQRGRAPDLHTALSTPRVTRARHRGWIAAGAVAIVGVAVVGWLMREPILPGPTLPTPTPTPAAVSPPTAHAPPAAVAAPIQPPQATPRTAQPDAARRESPSDDHAQPVTPDTNTGSPARVATAPPIAEAEPSMDPAPAPMPPDTEALRRLGDLDSSTRAQLPPLKVSMHVWNDAPHQRFALIDGQRLGEGAQIGEAVVERIDRDGVVLSWRGERLLLPRP